MSFFAKIFGQTEPEPAPSAICDADRLLSITEEYRRAEAEFSQAHLAVCRYVNSHPKPPLASFAGDRLQLITGEKSFDKELAQLEAERVKAFRKRNELLSQRAELLKALGRI
jgi:hypothetical protein